MNLVPKRALSGIKTLIEFYGEDPRLLLQSIGISPDFFDSSEELIDGQILNDVVEQGARFLNNRFFGLEIGKIQGATTLGSLWFLLRNSATIGEQVNNLVVNFPVHTSGSFFNTEVEEKGTMLTYDLDAKIMGSHVQLIEAGLSSCCIELRRYIDPQWFPTAVYFKTEQPYDKKPLVTIFGENLYFNQEVNGILITNEELKLPLRDASQLQYQHYDHEMLILNDFNPSSFAVKTENIISASLTKNRCTLVFVAKCLGLTPRTLQEKLKKCGTNFQSILQTSRLNLALRYLQKSNLSITEISLRLQFSEVAAFSRFIKKNTGKAPKYHRG